MNQNTQWKGQQAEQAERSLWKQEFSSNHQGERLIEDNSSWWDEEK